MNQATEKGNGIDLRPEWGIFIPSVLVIILISIPAVLYPKAAEEVVSAVRKVCTVPLVVKLSPQAESIPDMCKAVDKAMVITDVHLLSKAGGKSGDFVWKQASEA